MIVDEFGLGMVVMILIAILAFIIIVPPVIRLRKRVLRALRELEKAIDEFHKEGY